MAQQVHNIAGHQVHFGRQPFGPQCSLMAKVIQAIRSPANALLESPTGTGKTLALLGAALAAQHVYRQQLAAAKAINHAILHIEKLARQAPAAPPAAAGVPPPAGGALSDAVREDDAPVIYFFSRTHSQLSQVIREYGKLIAYTQPGGAALAGPTREGLREAAGLALAGPHATHLSACLTLLQLPEGVSPADALLHLAELAAPPSLPPPVMTILASRSRTCVNEDALSGDISRLLLADAGGAGQKKKRRSGGGAAGAAAQRIPEVQKTGRGVDDACSALLAMRACRYSNGSDRLAYELPPVWDTDVSTALGRNLCGCPYFAARTVHENANVVFAPYSYLVDPVSALSEIARLPEGCKIARGRLRSCE